jgi:4'-phosphopantetheinyl transferase
MRPAFTCTPAFAEASALPGLALELGLPGPARFKGHDPHGRPLADCEGAPVPVSFSRSGAVCAVALGRAGRVGVDLVDPHSHIPAEGLFELAAPEERLWLSALPAAERRRKLFQVWACREALLKALGLGLTLDPGAVALEPSGDGLRPSRVLGSPTPPVGWHVEVRDGEGLAEGLILALAWAD